MTYEKYTIQELQSSVHLIDTFLMQEILITYIECA